MHYKVLNIVRRSINHDIQSHHLLTMPLTSKCIHFLNKNNKVDKKEHENLHKGDNLKWMSAEWNGNEIKEEKILWNSHMTSLQTITTQYFISLPFFYVYAIRYLLMPVTEIPLFRLPSSSHIYFYFHSLPVDRFFSSSIFFTPHHTATRKTPTTPRYLFPAHKRVDGGNLFLCFSQTLFSSLCFMFLSCCSFHVCTCVHYIKGILPRGSAFLPMGEEWRITKYNLVLGMLN